MILPMFICFCITILIAFLLWCGKEITTKKEFKNIEEQKINAIIELKNVFINHLDKLDLPPTEINKMFEMFLKALN